jgi:hypothetical protein
VFTTEAVYFMTFELRMRAIRRRRLASRLSGASMSALWIACFVALLMIVGVELLNSR